MLLRIGLRFARAEADGAHMKRFINRETLLYLLFGVLTTVVNYLVFWLGIRLVGEQYTLLINVVCFVVAASFAYVTNKLIVFESKSWQPAVAGREFVGFIGARLFSLLVELLFMFVTVTVLGMNEVLAKVIVQIIVVILNYVFSKRIIFRK